MDEDEIKFFIFVETLYDCVNLLPNYFFSISFNMSPGMFYSSSNVIYLHISKSFKVINFSYTQNSISVERTKPYLVEIPDISIIRVLSHFSSKKLNEVYLNRIQVFNTKTREIRDF